MAAAAGAVVAAAAGGGAGAGVGVAPQAANNEAPTPATVAPMAHRINCLRVTCLLVFSDISILLPYFAFKFILDNDPKTPAQSQ